MWRARSVLPRSFLYVPANKPDLFDKASRGPADALIFDLEDAVPPAEKDLARSGLREWFDSLASNGVSRDDSPPGSQQRWVRISSENITADLGAVVGPSLQGLVLAKCTEGSLSAADAVLGTLERDRGLPRGGLGIIGLIESAEALLQLTRLAAHPRLVTFAIGEVDLLSDLRMARGANTEPVLDGIRSQIVIHSVAGGCLPPVAPTSVAFRDLDAFAASSRKMLELGFRSRTAIHPAQIAPIHETFTPNDLELRAAGDVVGRFKAARGGVTVDADGRMIDAAVVRSATETLMRGRQWK